MASTVFSGILYEKYLHYIAIGGVVILMGVGGVYGYRLYTISLDKLAQSSFATCVQEFEKATQDPILWPEVELAAKTGYYQHRNSSLASYFLGLQADALIQQNKLSEALEAMKESLKQLSKNSPLYYQYANKYALMQLDADDQEVQVEGLKSLESLAANEHNTQRDQSLYCLGLYRWNNKDKEGALSVWQKLIDTYSNQELFGSPWVPLAITKIESQIVG